MKIKHYWDLITKKIKVSKPASFLSVKNIFAVLQASYRSIGGFALKPHIYEQIIWRRIQVSQKSPECWNQGYCKICGCEIIGKTMEDRKCENENPCYPEMMSEDQWKEFKKLNNINYFE